MATVRSEFTSLRQSLEHQSASGSSSRRAADSFNVFLLTASTATGHGQPSSDNGVNKVTTRQPTGTYDERESVFGKDAESSPEYSGAEQPEVQSTNHGDSNQHADNEPSRESETEASDVAGTTSEAVNEDATASPTETKPEAKANGANLKKPTKVGSQEIIPTKSDGQPAQETPVSIKTGGQSAKRPASGENSNRHLPSDVFAVSENENDSKSQVDNEGQSRDTESAEVKARRRSGNGATLLIEVESTDEESHKPHRANLAAIETPTSQFSKKAGKPAAPQSADLGSAIDSAKAEQESDVPTEELPHGRTEAFKSKQQERFQSALAEKSGSHRTIVPPNVVRSLSGQNSSSDASGENTEGTESKSTATESPLRRAPVLANALGRVSQKLTSEGEPSGPQQVDRVRLLQRVVRGFQEIGHGGGQLRIRLSPPELGSLHLEVIVKHGAMSARVEAETSAAQTAILENLAGLRDRLAAQDIRLERFEVNLSDRSQQDLPGKNPGSSHQPGSGHERKSDSQRQNVGEPPVGKGETRAREWIESDHVNVVI